MNVIKIQTATILQSIAEQAKKILAFQTRSYLSMKRCILNVPFNNYWGVSIVKKNLNQMFHGLSEKGLK